MTASQPVYVGQAGAVTALDVETGDIIWSVVLHDFDGCSACRGEPVVLQKVERGSLLAGCAGHVFCLCVVDGDLNWHRDLRRRGKGDTFLVQ